MTNNEILKADLLDILFEHRNKSYGAYALRRYYNSRLLIALGIALSAVLLFFLLSLFNRGNRENIFSPTREADGVKLTEIKIEKEKIPEHPKKIQPVAQKEFKNIVIVKDKDVNKPMNEQKDLINVAISNKDADGVIPEDPNKGITNEVSQAGIAKQETGKEKELLIEELPPSFPGGPEALALFFSRTLSSPTDLEPGEKKVILVRFVVGADGSITKSEVIQSGGDSYDREVLRAFKRMPKWNPAIQNGIKVATSFTQPVTFIGVEQ